MKTNQGKILLAMMFFAATICGCNLDPTVCQDVGESRDPTEPGTKVTKEDSTICKCSGTMSSANVCCTGCRFGDAVACTSNGTNNVCASSGSGGSEGSAEEPDPKCSLVDDYITAQVNNPPLGTADGYGLPDAGEVEFKWGWFNPHDEELPTSDELMQQGKIRQPLRLHGHKDSHDPQMTVRWDEVIPSCEPVDGEGSLTLEETGFWEITIDNLPGEFPEIPSLQVF